jgi:hypothetical protein
VPRGLRPHRANSAVAAAAVVVVVAALVAGALGPREVGAAPAQAMVMADAPPAATVRADAFAGRGATVSTSGFQAAHDGHWPDHFGAVAAHAWQT